MGERRVEDSSRYNSLPFAHPCGKMGSFPLPTVGEGGRLSRESFGRYEVL